MENTGREIALTLKDFEIAVIIKALKAEKEELDDALVYGDCDSGSGRCHSCWLEDFIKRLESLRTKGG